MTVTEESLTTAAVGGDHAALAELLERGHADVCRLVASAIPASHRALIDPDDVYQVTCIEAFLNVRHFRPDGSGAFVAWLTRIAQNNLRDAVRWLDREKRMPPRKQAAKAHASDSYIGLLANLAGTTTTPSGHAVRGEIKDALDEAIGMLPKDYQTVVRITDLEERTAQEAAAEMGKTRAAVYMLRARAHEHLAKLLGDSSRFFR